VPDHRKYCHQVGQRLRDDLLAQLRTARRPMSTTELRDNAPTQPIRAGSAVTVDPLQEQVYRALCVLRAHGKVEQHRSQGRIVTWVAVADTDADDEVADLEAAFHASPVPGGGQPPADAQRNAAHLRAAARTASHAVRHQPHTAAAVTEALSAVITVPADVHQVHGQCCTHLVSVDGTPLFHWVFARPARLALPTHGCGFAGLRPVAWSVLIRRSARIHPKDRS
jgi:hypothetical protein